ncbi:MAG: hypothetical protein EOP39_17110 [Rubrivivax sp.]|nr:MAG: hypothetical protein EOP39_17110 [Rubrivivax sp.]
MPIATVMLVGCAAPPPEQQVAEPAREKCVVVTGSSVCRKEGSGQIANVQSVPGKVLTSRPGEITGPAPGKVGD